MRKMTGAAIGVAILVVAGGVVTVARAADERVGDLERRLRAVEREEESLRDQVSELRTSLQETSAATAQVQAQLAKVLDCLPDLQLEAELLDVRDGSGGTFMPYQSVATQVSPSCRRVLRVQFIGSD